MEIYELVFYTLMCCTDTNQTYLTEILHKEFYRNKETCEQDGKSIKVIPRYSFTSGPKVPIRPEDKVIKYSCRVKRVLQ